MICYGENQLPLLMIWDVMVNTIYDKEAWEKQVPDWGQTIYLVGVRVLSHVDRH